jgi:hypothetical protein
MSKLYPARRLPQIIAAIGILLVVISCATAVAHFLFGMPVSDRNTGRSISDASFIMALGLFAFVGALLAGTGVAVLRAAARHHQKVQSRRRS